MLKDIIIKSYSFNLLYAEKLIEDVTEDQMYFSPGIGLENHPAFTLGHLVIASASTLPVFGCKDEIPPGWEEIFDRKGPGDPRIPSTDKGVYPGKNTIFNEYKRQHQRLENAISDCDDDILAKPSKWRFTKYFPTLGDAVYFMCVIHETMHLSQLGAWRRAMNLPSAFKEL